MIKNYKFKIFIVCILSIVLVINFIGVNISAVSAQGTPSLSAKSAILIQASTGKILYSKNPREKLANASTTKILSTLITLDQPNLDEEFVVDKDAIKIEGSSMGLVEGDIVTLRTLAYGMMLPSGNDASNAAAVRIAGSIHEFAKLMNQYARTIGMKNSNFVTPSGLDDNDHYTTAEDLALLMRYAMQNASFREITKSKTARLKYGNPPYDRTLVNHNKLLNSYEYAVGGKTGFTSNAGRCLVSAATKDDLTLIAVTLNASSDWDDHTQMYNYGFNYIKPISINVDVNDLTVQVVGGESETLNVAPLESSVNVFVEQQDISNLKQKIILEPFYYSPIMENDVIGEIQYLLDDNLVGKVTLLAKESIDMHQQPPKQASFFDKIKDVFDNIINNIKKIFE